MSLFFLVKKQAWILYVSFISLLLCTWEWVFICKIDIKFQILQQVRILLVELCNLSHVETPDELVALDAKLDERVRYIIIYIY